MDAARVVEMLTNAGLAAVLAGGFIFLAYRVVHVTLPKMQEKFDESLAEQRREFAAMLAASRADALATLERQRQATLDLVKQLEERLREK